MTFKRLQFIYYISLIGIFTYFVVLNSGERVNFDLLFTKFEDVPLLFVVFISFILGGFVTVFLEWWYFDEGKKKDKTNKKREKDVREGNLPLSKGTDDNLAKSQNNSNRKKRRRLFKPGPD